MTRKRIIIGISLVIVIVPAIIFNNFNAISIFFENKFQFREDSLFSDTTQIVYHISDSNIIFNFHDPDFTDISSYISTRIDHDFDINNYTIHLSYQFENDGVIVFVYTVNGIETNISYNVIINDGICVRVSSNGNFESINIPSNLPIITEELLETAKSKARRRINNRHYTLESQSTRPIIDVNTNRVYIYVFSEIEHIVTNTFAVVSYRYRVQ